MKNDAIAPLAHSVTAEIEVSWQEAFALLSDPAQVGRWALGSWGAEPAGAPGLYTGVSLLSGERSWFRVAADQSHRLIDYCIGDRTVQVPRISTRVVPAEHYRGPPGRCLVTITAWRDAAMDARRWHALCVAHEAEILLIKALLEGRR